LVNAKVKFLSPGMPGMPDFWVGRPVEKPDEERLKISCHRTSQLQWALYNFC